MLAAASVVITLGIGALAIVTDAPRPSTPLEVLVLDQYLDAFTNRAIEHAVLTHRRFRQVRRDTPTRGTDVVH